ncbi:phospholipase D1-like isoform X1, partial [Tachysurus ichikawai]
MSDVVENLDPRELDIDEEEAEEVDLYPGGGSQVVDLRWWSKENEEPDDLTMKILALK